MGDKVNPRLLGLYLVLIYWGLYFLCMSVHYQPHFEKGTNKYYSYCFPLCVYAFYTRPGHGSPRHSTGTEEMAPREAGFHVFPSQGFMFSLLCIFMLPAALSRRFPLSRRRCMFKCCVYVMGATAQGSLRPSLPTTTYPIISPMCMTIPICLALGAPPLLPSLLDIAPRQGDNQRFTAVRRVALCVLHELRQFLQAGTAPHEHIILEIAKIVHGTSTKFLSENFVCVLFCIFAILGLGGNQIHWEKGMFSHVQQCFPPLLPTP